MDDHAQQPLHPGGAAVRRPDADRSALSSQQLTSALRSGDGSAGLLISASKEVEPGTRAMLLLAEGLFRLDVTISGDTLRTVVRNFTNDALTMRGGVYGPDGANIVLGEAAAYAPARTAVEFTIGPVEVSVTLGTLRFADRGSVRVSAQAIVREPGP